MEGKTIAQTMAAADIDKTKTVVMESHRETGPCHRYGDAPATMRPSERVVRSHLRYLEHFEPFRHGLVTKSTLYEFLFYMIVEKGKRESYTKRVIKSVMMYLKSGGAAALEIPLTDESKEYVERFRGMGDIRMSVFYKSMDALANSLGDDRVKRMLSTARSKRTLVFTDDEESNLIRYCVHAVRDIVQKYTDVSHHDWTTVMDVHPRPPFDRSVDVDTRSAAADTEIRRVDYERTIFEFAFAYLLGFLSGARIKSTVLRLSITDVDKLLAGERLEVLTKGVFVNVFLPNDVLNSERRVYGQIVTPLRTDSVLFVGRGSVVTDRDETKFFTRTPRQLELMLDRVHQSLFADKKRTKGVRWHSQRRRYLGAVNTRFGATTASESVGHRDLLTTMAYINNSVHMDDVQRKAGHAITDRYKQIISD